MTESQFPLSCKEFFFLSTMLWSRCSKMASVGVIYNIKWLIKVIQDNSREVFFLFFVQAGTHSCTPKENDKSQHTKYSYSCPFSFQQSVWPSLKSTTRLFLLNINKKQRNIKAQAMTDNKQSASWTDCRDVSSPCAPAGCSWGPEDRRPHPAALRAGAGGSRPWRSESCQAGQRWAAVWVHGAELPHPRVSDPPVVLANAATGTPRTRCPAGRLVAGCLSLPPTALQ